MENSQTIIDDSILELRGIIVLLQEIVNTPFVANSKIENSERSLETLAINCIYKSYSVIELSKGFTMELYKKTETFFQYDTSGVNLILRGLLENYLTLEYLYFNTLSKEEQIFRVKLWEVSGLIARGRLDFERHKEIGSDIRKMIEDKLKNEKVAIDKIMLEIKAMPQYSTLSNKQIGSLNNYGLPRTKSWSQIIENSTLNTSFFQNAYSLLCNNAHSEFLSILQISQTDPFHTLNNITQALRTVKLIDCLLIKKMTKKFKSCEIIYNSFSSTDLQIIESYSNVAMNV